MNGDEMAQAMTGVRTAAVTVDAHLQGTHLPLAEIARDVANCAGMRVVSLSDGPDLIIFVRATGFVHHIYHPQPGRAPERCLGPRPTPGADVSGEIILGFTRGGCHRMGFRASVPPAYRHGLGAQAAYDDALREPGGFIPFQGIVAGYVSALVNLVARTHGVSALRAALASEDWGLRGLAALRLGLMRDHESAELIAPLLRDPNPRVRMFAEDALRMMGQWPPASPEPPRMLALSAVPPAVEDRGMGVWTLTAHPNLHDLQGVASGDDAEQGGAGEAVARWDGCDGSGHVVEPGIYLAELEREGVSGTRKVAVVR